MKKRLEHCNVCLNECESLCCVAAMTARPLGQDFRLTNTPAAYPVSTVHFGNSIFDLGILAGAGISKGTLLGSIAELELL